MCEPDEDEEFDAYKLTLEVVISADNKVKNIQNIKWSDRYMSAHGTTWHRRLWCQS